MTLVDFAPSLPAWRQQQVARGVLPIVAIAGTHGKSTVAWMLSAALRDAHAFHASWVSAGVFVNDERQRGELGPWSRIVLAARHGELDVVLQEMNSPTVVSAGLPAATYPMAVLTALCGNNESCLLIPESRRDRRAIEIVTEAVRADGTIIANADDFDVLQIAQAHPANKILFALHPENPALQLHLERGGRASWLEHGILRVSDGARTLDVMSADAIPATLDGTILFQLQNALATCSAALALGLDLAHVAQALAEFKPDPLVQPAASNIVRFNQSTIVVDAPRRITSIRLLARGIRHWPRRRTIVVSGCLPSLTNDEAREAGRLLGTLAGIVVLHHENGTDERLAAIRAGVAAAAVPPIIVTLPDELQAIDQLLNMIAPGDAALVVADDPAVVLDHLWPAPRISIGSARRLRDRVSVNGVRS